MKNFRIKVLKSALEDIHDVACFISNTYKAPLTAQLYVKGLWAEIKKLSVLADSIPVSDYMDIIVYGKNARKIKYKSHIIIYTIQGNTVVIRKIISAALIKC